MPCRALSRGKGRRIRLYGHERNVACGKSLKGIGAFLVQGNDEAVDLVCDGLADRIARECACRAQDLNPPFAVRCDMGENAAQDGRAIVALHGDYGYDTWNAPRSSWLAFHDATEYTTNAVSGCVRK